MKMIPAKFHHALLTLLLAIPALAADWPMWGGRPTRNMVNDAERGLPDNYALGIETDNDTPQLAATKNIKWFAKLGGKTCGSPVVSGGRVFIGTQGVPSANDIILCLDERTGQKLGEFICRRLEGRGEHWGVCSTPTVEGDRLYFVSPYGDMVCVDLAAWLTAPDTASLKTSERAIVWRFDMTAMLHVDQDHAASCSPLIVGDYIYVCTGNGRYKTDKHPFHPLTPSLVVFNKHTGQLVARDDEQIGEQLWRGQWSSPSFAEVNGKPQILFATGNDFCYAFEPVDPAAKVASNQWLTTTLRGPITYYIDVDKKDYAGLTPAEYAKKFPPLPPGRQPAAPLEFRYVIKMPQVTPIDRVPTAQVPDVPLLKKIWWFDVLTPEYRNAPFFARGGKGDHRKHPSDIIGTPVFYSNRVYVAIGGDPNHASKDNLGRLVCYDITKTGDLTRTGEVWHDEQLQCALTTPALCDGLLYIIDEASTVHCLDADTGRRYWTYKLESDRGLLSSALLVADGKVFVGKAVLAAGKTLKVLSNVAGKTSTSCSVPCAANGTLYIVHGKWLWEVSQQQGGHP